MLPWGDLSDLVMENQICIQIFARTSALFPSPSHTSHKPGQTTAYTTSFFAASMCRCVWSLHLQLDIPNLGLVIAMFDDQIH